MNIEKLHQELTDCLSPVKLGVAGRILYYESGRFILGMHSTSPERTHEATQLAWDSITELKEELQEANIGFTGKQI